MIRRHQLGVYVTLVALVVGWWALRFDEGAPRESLDTLLYFLPAYASIAEHFRTGAVPLWNPYQLCGLPWIGTLQGGVFYPPHVLYLVLPLHQALAISNVLHLTIAALATAAFVQRLGLGSAAAFLAAVLFTLRGSVGTAPPSPNLLEAIAWLPVGAVALVGLARASGPGAIALLGAATAMSFLAGYPQPTVYIVYVWGSLFVALLIHERPSVGDVVVRSTAFAGALALGAAVAAVQLFPALELMTSGTRTVEGLSDRTMFAVAPLMTPATSVLRWRTISGTPFALGVVALALVPAAVLAPGRRVIGWWALAVTALSGTWALGRLTPLFDVYLALPALRLFRNPGRLLIVTDFAVAVAAALALSALMGRAADASPARRAGHVVAASMALTLAGVLELVRRGWAPDGGWLVVAFAVVSVATIVALLCSDASWRPAIGGAVVVAVTIEVASNPGSEFRLPYAAADIAIYEKHAQDLRHLARIAGHDRVWRALTGLHPSNALKLSTWHRLRTISDYEPVNLQRQADFFTYLADGATQAKRSPWLFPGDVQRVDAPPDGTPPATRRRLLDLAAVRYVVFARGALTAPPVASFVAQAGLVRVEPTANLVVFENPRALPRAFVTYHTRAAPDDPDALLQAISAESFDPLVESFVEGPPPFVAAGDAPARGHRAEFVRDDETDVELDVTLDRPGLLVLADSFYPGWRATVDGTATPIVATNHLFRGVPVPAGPHRVRFVYAPTSVHAGGLVSVLGLCVLGWLIFRARRDRLGDPISPSQGT